LQYQNVYYGGEQRDNGSKGPVRMVVRGNGIRFPEDREMGSFCAWLQSSSITEVRKREKERERERH